MSKVLVLASGRSALQYKEYPYKKNDWVIVAANNGWMAAKDEWDYWNRPSDYKGERPTSNDMKHGGKEIKTYINQLNKFGGHHACGYSITIVTAYWALAELKPSIIAFLGADMDYTPDEKGNTHFYGVGYDIKKRKIPDPFHMAKTRSKGTTYSEDEYIDMIYGRLETVANEHSCRVYNLSHTCPTLLKYERTTPLQLDNT